MSMSKMKVVGLLFGGALVVAACGETNVAIDSGEPSTSESSGSTADSSASSSTSAAAGAEVFDARGFDIEAVDLSTGSTVTLADYVDGTKPVVVWGFAPHCGTCLAEVPAFNALIEQNPDVQVIGIGQTDNLDLAFSFFGAAQPNFPLVYATGGDIWNEAALGFQRMNVYSPDLTQKVNAPFHFSNKGALNSAIEQLGA